MAPADVHVRVHERGDRSLDGILRLIELAGGDRGREQVLCAMCAEMATITGAQVASVYVRDRGPRGNRPIMRGNLGFPRTAIARARAPAAAVLRAGGIPLVVEIAGLFAWTRPRDLLIVDGDGGQVRVNPTSDRVARVRQGSAGK